MRTSRWSAVPLAAACAFACAPAWAATASHPDDICPADADPCVVDHLVIVEAGVDLDFGLRTVLIERGGKLALSGSGGSVQCGGLVVEPGGTLDLSGRYSDVTFSLIDFYIHGRCANAPTVVCDSDYACSGSECTAGNVSILGRLNARAAFPVWSDIHAAGDIAVDGRVDFSGRPGGDGSGGTVLFQAGRSIEFRGELRGRARGYDGTGAWVDLWAREDVRVIDAEFDLDGADFDGGGLVIDAGADAFFSGVLRASSKKGAGYGGFLEIYADGNAVLANQSDGRPSSVALNGHRAQGGFSAGSAGQGGTFAMRTRGDAVIDDGIVIDARGGATASGGYVGVLADGNVVLGAIIDASTPAGVAGDIEVRSYYGTVSVEPEAILRVDGDSSGSVDVDAEGAVSIAGEITSTNTGTRPAAIRILSEDDITISGSMSVYAEPQIYQPSTSISVRGCDVSFVGSGSAAMDANGWGISITSRETMLVDTGASLTAPGSVSSINLVHRDPLQPPALLGTVAPAPNVVVNSSLTACP